MPDPMSKRFQSFFASPRLVVIGGILGVVAALLLLALILGRGSEAPSTEEPEPPASYGQNPPEPPIEPAAAPAPSADEEPQDTIAREEEAAPSVLEQPPEETTAGLTGPGRIYGTVVMPGGAPVPEDMRVELHRYDSESAEVSYDDTLLETVAPGSEGAFDFEGLALKSYALFATSAGYTMHTTATLTRIRTERNVTLRVVPGGAIAGRVLNEADEPVAGAHVFTAAWNMGGQTSNAPRSRALASRVTTDEEGAFVMRNLRFGAPGEQGYRLAVKAEGYATYLSDYMLAGTQGVDLVLSFGGMIAGQLVRAETGEPATDMVITLDSELAMENLSTTSDAEGWFFMTGVPAGSHRARLVDDELVVVPETAHFDVAEGEQTTEILIEVAMGGRITGRVYDGDTGAGIAGAKLRAAPEGFSLTVRPSADTDGQGRYEMKGLEPGAYNLRLDKPEGYPNNSRSQQDRTRSVMAKLESETSGVDFELTKGIQIFGVVVDEEGRPLAQVLVYASVERGSASDSDRTKQDGLFVVAGFPPNSTVRINAQKSGFAMESTEPEEGRVEIEEGNVTGIRFVMGPESSISGSVVDSFGNPKARLQLMVQNITPGGRGGSATTSVDGAFTVDGLSAGEYKFQFSNSGVFTTISGSAAAPGVTVRLAKGEKITGLRLVYDEPEGLTITGRVTDSQGKAIPRASISVQGGPSWASTQAETDGTYTLTGLGEGTYSVSAYSYSHSPSQPFQVAAGSRNVNFVLSSLAVIEGQVLSARTGAPITSFQVRAQKRGGTRYFVRDQFKAFSDPEGRFRLSEVEEGAATLTARAEGYAKATADVNVIVGGETVRGVVLRLEEGVKLAGHVVNRSGAPISSSQIFLGSVPNEWQRDREALTRTNRDGEFNLTSLPAGDVTLSAFHREYTPTTVTVSLSRYSENRVEIVLLQGGVVEGYVTLAGSPQPDQNVRIRVERQSNSASTDAEGHYRIVGLPDGTFIVSASLRVNNSSRSQSRQGEVADDMTTTVDFNFAPGSSAIEGTVYEDEVTPLRQQAHISASIDVGGGVTESMSTRTGPDGTFVLEGLPAGLVTLRVGAQGFPAKKVELELGDRQTVHQDIFLFGGATIVCEMSGGNAGDGPTVVVALSGVVDVPDLSIEFVQTLSQDMVSTAQFVNGVARLSGLEPGTYTVLAIIYDTAAMTAGSDPLATAQWQTSVVEVEKDQIVSVSFSF